MPMASPQPLPQPCAVTDAELYRYAVDMSDIDAILRHPQLPPFFATADEGSGSSTSNDCSAVTTTMTTRAMANGHTHGTTGPAATREPRARTAPLSFECITHDDYHGISLYSAPVEGCAVRLMCARAVMPCTPAALLRYMQSDVRPHWDSHIQHNHVVRELSAPVQQTSCDDVADVCEHMNVSSRSSGKDANAMTTMRAAAAAAAAQRRRSSRAGCSARVRDLSLSQALLLHPLHAKRHALSLATLHTATTAGSSHAAHDDEHVISSSSGSSSAAMTPPCAHAAHAPLAAASSPFAFAPGQCRVALQYVGIRSPLLLVQDRDFELVVCERVLRDGTAYLKAFSAPPGYAVPLDPRQTRYVRAIAFLAAVVARPLTWQECTRGAVSLPPSLRGRGAAAAATKAGDAGSNSSSSSNSKMATPEAPREYCVMSYLGLIHPLGLLPPVVADFVTNAQVTTLQSLQRYILQHPITLPHEQLQQQAQAQTRSVAKDSKDKSLATRAARRARRAGESDGDSSVVEQRWWHAMRSRL